MFQRNSVGLSGSTYARSRIVWHSPPFRMSYGMVQSCSLITGSSHKCFFTCTGTCTYDEARATTAREELAWVHEVSSPVCRVYAWWKSEPTPSGGNPCSSCDGMPFERRTNQWRQLWLSENLTTWWNCRLGLRISVWLFSVVLTCWDWYKHDVGLVHWRQVRQSKMWMVSSRWMSHKHTMTGA